MPVGALDGRKFLSHQGGCRHGGLICCIAENSITELSRATEIRRSRGILGTMDTVTGAEGRFRFWFGMTVAGFATVAAVAGALAWLGPVLVT